MPEETAEATAAATEATEEVAEAAEATEAVGEAGEATAEVPEAVAEAAEATGVAAEATGVAAEATGEVAEAAEAEDLKAEVPVEAAAAPGEGENPEDLLDDIVPYVTYDEDKSNFVKEGRWVLPKRSQFPSIFCPLRVRVRLVPVEVGTVNPWKLPVGEATG